MKWSIFVCLLVCLARFCEGGALRCPPGVKDTSCMEEKKEDYTQQGSGSSEVQCLAGTEWESNCHYCVCSDTGIAECLDLHVCENETFAEPSLCKPNTTFQRDCNTCVCLENGLGLCTLQYCRRSGNMPGPLELSDVSKSEKESSKEVETPTLVAPIQNNGNEDFFLEFRDNYMLKLSTICKPQEEFMKECNPCKCSADGLSYTCTRNECLEVDAKKEVEVFMKTEGVDHIERNSVCRARETLIIGCNMCRCNAFGTEYSCTNKPCPLPPDVEVFDDLKITRLMNNGTKTQVCIANRMFVKDCNMCVCNEDGTSYVCTRRTCVPLLPDEEQDLGGIPAEELRVTKEECRPNEVFELDCNMCRCNPDGKSYSCTRRACADPEDKEKPVTMSRKVRSLTTEMPKACKPGQEFRMDCNKCLCDNMGQDFSCTRIDCNALNNNHEARRKREVSDPIQMKCVAGSVFDIDCNVCSCTKDGNHATCTIKRCKQNNELDSEVRPTESDQGFRCNAGEQFKRDCNDCTCSADGKSVFCTLRLCDETLIQ